MAIQSEVFSTSFGVRSFSSTKHIATKQHMAVWLKRVSDDLWTQLSVNKFELINNSAVLTEVPSSILYSQIEIRVADEPDELGTSQSDITIVAGLATQMQEIVDNVVPNIDEILLADDNAIIATTQAGVATTQAGIATTKASEASTSASNALVSEQNADASEANALTYKNDAQSARDIAVASKDIAVTKAGEASTSATQALGYRNEAEGFRDEAETFADSIDPSNLVSKTGDETIDGVKTFTSSPIAPTPTNGDNTTKVATTEFVNDVLNSKPCFSAFASANQSITSGVATKLQFNTEEFDKTNAYNVSLYRFTPVTLGVYKFTSSITTSTITDGILRIYKNGAVVKDARRVYTQNVESCITVEAMIEVTNASDYFEIYTSLFGTSPIVYGSSTRTFFQSHYVRS